MAVSMSFPFLFPFDAPFLEYECTPLKNFDCSLNCLQGGYIGAYIGGGIIGLL